MRKKRFFSLLPGTVSITPVMFFHFSSSNFPHSRASPSEVPASVNQHPLPRGLGPSYEQPYFKLTSSNNLILLCLCHGCRSVSEASLWCPSVSFYLFRSLMILFNQSPLLNSFLLKLLVWFWHIGTVRFKTDYVCLQMQSLGFCSVLFPLLLHRHLRPGDKGFFFWPNYPGLLNLLPRPPVHCLHSFTKNLLSQFKQIPATLDIWSVPHLPPPPQMMSDRSGSPSARILLGMFSHNPFIPKVPLLIIFHPLITLPHPVLGYISHLPLSPVLLPHCKITLPWSLYPLDGSAYKVCLTVFNKRH